MELTQDYKNIVKLRFNDSQSLGNTFFDAFFEGIQNPNNFDDSIFKKLDLGIILNYLKKSHTEYLTLWFPKVESLSM